jgi:glycosyltransferase involved in cell wall biosynthesis
MRVAVFTETFLPKTDGIVRVVCLLLDHLKMRGIEPIVVAPRIGDPLTEYNGIPVLTVPSVTVPWYPELKAGPPTPFTYRDIVDFKPDIAHFIHPVMVGIPGMAIAKSLGIPTLASFHIDIARMADHFGMGFLRGFTDFATRVVFNWADYSLAPSKLIQEDMIRLGIKDVGLWKRGVDAEKFNPRFKSAEMRYHLSDGHPEDTLLLYVGRLSNEKQIDQLRHVLERVPNTRLALVGDGPAREQLVEHFKGTKTKFVGYLKGEALSQAYASADIFTFSSAIETFGLVVVEAMAAGLPVVSSRVGGIRDVVQEGETGYTFDVNDLDQLVSGVQKVAIDRQNIDRMGRNARAFAETQTWPAMMDEVIVHYSRLIEDAKRGVAISA